MDTRPERDNKLEAQRVETEDVFRSANERIAEKGRELGWRFPVPFLCECSNHRCFGRIELPLMEYREIRLHPYRYLTLPRHEVANAFVLEQDEKTSVAEKLYSSAESS